MHVRAGGGHCNWLAAVRDAHALGSAGGPSLVARLRHRRGAPAAPSSNPASVVPAPRGRDRRGGGVRTICGCSGLGTTGSLAVAESTDAARRATATEEKA